MQSASSAEKFSFIYFGSSQASASFFFIPALYKIIYIYIYLYVFSLPNEGPLFFCHSDIFFTYVCPIELPAFLVDTKVEARTLQWWDQTPSERSFPP